MNDLRVLTGAIVLSLFLAPLPTYGDATRMISGELVVLTEGRNQFRIVDHAGSFTAPPGLSIEELDGKAVEVDLGSNGQVLRITEKRIAIQPIEHGIEVVVGELLMVDAAAGKFTIAGDRQVYTAPPGFDLRPYAGRMVKVRLNAKTEVTGIDLSSVAAPDTYAAMGDAPCQAEGVAFADGATRCVGATGYRCEGGFWRNLGEKCGVNLAATTCSIGGATVADGSSICQQGRTMRCASGNWVASGTACR